MQRQAVGGRFDTNGVFLVSALFLLASMAAAVSLGAVSLGPSRVLNGLFDQGDSAARQIVWQLRVPRVLVAALVGANLSVAGVLLQGVTRNPLAGPHVLGLSAGAGFATITVVVAAPGTPIELVAPAAFLGAIAAAMVVYGLAWRGGISPVRFALSGVATAALFTALSTAVLANSDLFTQRVLSFLAGGLFARNWDDARQIAPYTFALGATSLAVAGALNVLALGDDVARGLGMQVERMRLLLVVLAAGLTGSAVAVSGMLAFVGLVVPHGARLLVGSDHRRSAPLAALLGASLLVLADTLSRVVIAPAEIPVGILTAVIGAPVFLLLIRMRT
ncbi:MAG: iron ABC transporter permease [Chloroflexi bacterium]|nr:iron ABC transporter permease [Chloroflexota bacterium]MDA1145889.1 iron ABC transporter permease [Chloroflexota bacterium]